MHPTSLFLALEDWLTSIHRAAEKGYSRKLSFRRPTFSESGLPAYGILGTSASKDADSPNPAQPRSYRTPLHRTGYGRYSLSFREPTFSEAQKGASIKRRPEPHDRNRILAFFCACCRLCERDVDRHSYDRQDNVQDQKLFQGFTPPQMKTPCPAPRECVETTISRRPELPYISKSFTLLCTIRFRDPPPYRHETDKTHKQAGFRILASVAPKQMPVALCNQPARLF